MIRPTRSLGPKPAKTEGQYSDSEQILRMRNRQIRNLQLVRRAPWSSGQSVRDL